MTTQLTHDNNNRLEQSDPALRKRYSTPTIRALGKVTALTQGGSYITQDSATGTGAGSGLDPNRRGKRF